MFIAYFCAVFRCRMHTTLWLEIEQCSNRCRNMVPDESNPRFAWHTYEKPVAEKGVNLQRWFLEHVSWVLHNRHQQGTAKRGHLLF